MFGFVVLAFVPVILLHVSDTETHTPLGPLLVLRSHQLPLMTRALNVHLLQLWQAHMEWFSNRLNPLINKVVVSVIIVQTSYSW